MSLKRKMTIDEDLSTLHESRPMKQGRIQLSLDNQLDDIVMNDASSESSGASIYTSTVEIADYPRFDLYPFPSCDMSESNMDGVTENYQLTSSSESRTSSNASNDSSVGLLKPKSSFMHNVANCVQVPRLRVACEAGLGGARALWTQCDQCGAIEMIA